MPHGLIEHNHGYWACQPQMLQRVHHMNDVCALCWNALKDPDALVSLRQRAVFDANTRVLSFQILDVIFTAHATHRMDPPRTVQR